MFSEYFMDQLEPLLDINPNEKVVVMEKAGKEIHAWTSEDFKETMFIMASAICTFADMYGKGYEYAANYVTEYNKARMQYNKDMDAAGTPEKKI